LPGVLDLLSFAYYELFGDAIHSEQADHPALLIAESADRALDPRNFVLDERRLFLLSLYLVNDDVRFL
jgi:hypothetical protein